jgi:hypothetical protein
MHRSIMVTTEKGRLVIVKSAPLDAADALRAEGERLRRAAHPGVAELISSGPHGDRWELRTVHAGRPLSALRAIEPQHAAVIVAGVAATLADLHQAGIAHGRIDASHVVIGSNARPVLCGLGDGSSSATPAADVAALGELLTEMLERDEPGEPFPARRWRRHREAAGWERRALLTVADRACAEPPTCRPSARRLATDVAAAVAVTRGGVEAHRRRPQHRAPIEADGRPDVGATLPTSARLRSVRSLVVVAVIGVVAGALAFADDVARRGDPSRPPAIANGAAAPVGRSASSRTGSTTPDATIEIDQRTYRVGQRGDELLVADWDCDGVQTPALLRPATGEVFVFPRLAEDAALSVEPSLIVSGADALISRGSSGGCPDLAVRVRDGSVVPVLEAGSP